MKTTTVPAPSDATAAARVLRVAGRVSVPVESAWQAWSAPGRAGEFFAPGVELELRPGGRFDVFFNPADPAQSTRGSVLCLVPGEMLAFDWRLPPMFADLLAETMWVVVTFAADGPAHSVVTIRHLGWGEGPAWDDAFHHMERGWNDLLGRFGHRLAHGPIDWPAERATGDDAREYSLKARTVQPD